MKTKYTHLLRTFLFHLTLLLALILGLNSFGWGQTTLYTQNFGTSTSFPTGWIYSGSLNWTNSINSSSSGYAEASGGSNALHTNSVGTGTLTFSNNLSTVGYVSITVLWASNRTGNNVSTFQYSIDGSNWTSITFTEASNNSTWMLVNNGDRISLPTNASGVSNLRFRWVHTGDNSPINYIRLDDFSVQGCSATTINTQPANQTANVGASATFTVTATGTGLTYQWRKGSANIPDANNATYTISPVAPGDAAADYNVVVTGACGTVTSDNVTLTVNAQPIAAVTNQSNLSCFASADGTITVEASGGSGTGYTFSVDNGLHYVGSGNPYTFTGLSASIPYRVRVKDSNESQSPAIP